MSYLNTIQNLSGLTAVPSSSASKPVVNTAAAQSKTESSAASSSSTQRTKDQTTLSLASTLVASALQLSDVRTEKVAALQETIAAGRYNVSSSDVADKLLQALQG